MPPMTVAAEKQRMAEEVASKLGVSVDINTSASKTYVMFTPWLIRYFHLPNIKYVTSLDITIFEILETLLMYIWDVFYPLRRTQTCN